MDSIEDFSDDRQKSWCIHCGGWISELKTNRDHVPSKSLLNKPYPPNLPVVQICKICNSKFSKDEEYLVTFLHCVLAGSTDPDLQTNPKIRRGLKRNKKLRSRIEKSKDEYQTANGKTHFFWKPEEKRINKIALKNARGHAFYELGEPLLTEPSHIGFTPLEFLGVRQRKEFENTDMGSLLPEVGSRMMTRVLTGQDLQDGWVVVQDGVYRFAIIQMGVILVRSVLFEYLATEVYWEDN